VEHRILGGSGLSVSALGLGTMMFGPGGNTDEAECIGIVHRALDAGINFVDTADGYGLGQSERLVGRALAGGRRDRVVLASKCFFPRGRDVNQRGGSRRWIVRACEASLRRLGTDRLDLYQLHRIDPAVDPEESLGAMSELVSAGKVLAVGTSGAAAHEIVEEQWAAERARLVRPVSEQAPYSILVRGVERAVLPACQRHAIGVIAYSPLNGGWLTGKYRRDTPPPAGSRAANRFYSRAWWDFERPEVEAKLDVVDRLRSVADAASLRLADLAVAFTLAHPAVSTALVGPRTLRQLEDLLPAGGVRLDGDLLDRIDAIVAPGVDADPSDVVVVDGSLAASSRRRGWGERLISPIDGR
jgi:aryl-alcohol dehydrogenase-like predicted oxidoreductase